jgi:hypothetical protein
MSRNILLLAALAVLGVACDNGPVFTPTDGGNAASIEQPGPPAERLARLVARALSDPEFRSYLRAQLDASPYAEHKLHFQRLLSAGGGRALRAIARANGVADSVVLGEAGRVTALEIYLPVPAHRQAWSADENVLVATAMHDREAPVAFDPRGRRVVLSPD